MTCISNKSQRSKSGLSWTIIPISLFRFQKPVFPQPKITFLLTSTLPNLLTTERIKNTYLDFIRSVQPLTTFLPTSSVLKFHRPNQKSQIHDKHFLISVTAQALRFSHRIRSTTFLVTATLPNLLTTKPNQTKNPRVIMLPWSLCYSSRSAL